MSALGLAFCCCALLFKIATIPRLAELKSLLNCLPLIAGLTNNRRPHVRLQGIRKQSASSVQGYYPRARSARRLSGGKETTLTAHDSRLGQVILGNVLPHGVFVSTPSSKAFSAGKAPELARAITKQPAQRLPFRLSKLSVPARWRHRPCLSCAKWCQEKKQGLLFWPPSFRGSEHNVWSALGRRNWRIRLPHLANL